MGDLGFKIYLTAFVGLVVSFVVMVFEGESNYSDLFKAAVSLLQRSSFIFMVVGVLMMIWL